MSRRPRSIALLGLLLGIAGAVSSCGGGQPSGQSAPSTPAASTASPTAADSSLPAPTGVPPLTGSVILFRHTGLDSHYGTVAMVPLDDAGAEREFTGIPCDRVDATSEAVSCLVVPRGLETEFHSQVFDASWAVLDDATIEGVPSRTRLSPDGGLVSTTAFVTGHEYQTGGFSSSAEIRTTSGRLLGDLEDFALTLEGRPAEPEDRNYWGVSFVDDRVFYASLGTDDRTYLVRGDLEARTLTTVTENAECPSVSPDGRRVAFKVDVTPGSEKLWGLAVYDLASGTRTELENGPRGVDDQVQWLDEDTLLYGQPRGDQPGVDDVWAVDITPDARPRLLIEQAWSPAVVRVGGGRSR